MMKLFEVIMTRDATESVVVQIRANNASEAQTLALEDPPTTGWTLDDCNFHEPYTNGAEESPWPRNRADLMWRPAWAGMEVDTSGNPLVWMNHYEGWSVPWSCQCECDDDDGEEPYQSDWIGPADPAEIILWENLEDAP